MPLALSKIALQLAGFAKRRNRSLVIAIILLAVILATAAYAKPLGYSISLSTRETPTSYCCGSLVHRAAFYGTGDSELASLFIVTDSSWLSLNQVYLWLGLAIDTAESAKLDYVSLQLQSATTLGNVSWKNGGIAELWNPTFGNPPRVSVSEDGRTGTLTFPKVAHPEAAFAVVLEFSSSDKIQLALEFITSGTWAFGVLHYQGRLSLSVRPNQMTGVSS